MADFRVLKGKLELPTLTSKLEHFENDTRFRRDVYFTLKFTNFR